MRLRSASFGEWPIASQTFLCAITRSDLPTLAADINAFRTTVDVPEAVTTRIQAARGCARGQACTKMGKPNLP
ncbi:hypothetical protein OH77DRAFT_1419317 [Trametes cingulata]|nr:hypothetical protein OH77DRAFT_1419317 [Trametes cingulata]